MCEYGVGYRRGGGALRGAVALVACAVSSGVAWAADAAGAALPVKPFPAAQVFTVLFLMPRPFKILEPFAELTQGMVNRSTRQVALWGTIFASLALLAAPFRLGAPAGRVAASRWPWVGERGVQARRSCHARKGHEMKQACRARHVAALLVIALLSVTGAAKAQGQAAAADVAQANNPLANFTAFNVHNYYIGELTETDKDANQFWMRYARPFALGQTNWLMRASLPVNTCPVPQGMDHQTGLGDLNVFAAYLIDTGNPALSVGIGPQITAPTATEDALGSGKWSGGLVHTLFDASSRTFQYGYLLSWQASFAGADDRTRVNVGAFQPFMFYQLGGGTYLRATAVMSYNLENDTYSVPVGLGIGQVIPTPKAVFNLFIEPQWSVADKGAGWGQWQDFVGPNTQFQWGG